MNQTGTNAVAMPPAPCAAMPNSFVIGPVPETSGTIDKVFINLRPYDTGVWHSELDIAEAIAREVPDATIILGVEASGKFGHDAQEQRTIAYKRLSEAGVANVRFAMYPEKSNCPWARDLGFWTDGGRRFITSAGSPQGRTTAGLKTHNAEYRESLREALGVDEIAIAPFLFEGGDLLIADDIIFINKRIAATDDLRACVTRYFAGRAVIPIDCNNPRQHIDLRAGLAPGGVALVSSPQYLLDILRRAPMDDLRNWREYFTARYKSRAPASSFLFRINFEITRDIGYINQPGKFGCEQIPLVAAGETAVAERIAIQFMASGMQVVMLPGMPVIGACIAPVNCITDSYEEDGVIHRRIFVATYGFAPLDEAILSSLKSCGLFSRIIPIEVGWELAMLKGGLRCVANVLRRP